MERLDCDRMFVAVLETGSFAKAAVLQRTSSGQASKLISKLEADLGVQLLKRTTRSLSPTEIGQAYFEQIKPLLEHFATLDASIREASETASGRLRIAVPMSFGTIQLAPVLIDFARAYSQIELDVSFSDRLVNLVEEGFDLGVRIGAPGDSSLIGRRICDNHIVVSASPAYLALHDEPKHPRDLIGRECVIDSNFREPRLWRFRGEDDAPFAVQVAGRLRFSNAETCMAAAEAGLGIVRSPTFVVGARLAAGALRPLLRDYELRGHGVFVIYPAAQRLATKVRVLVDFLAERFRGEAPWHRGW